ncbi:RIP metalloprotease RseP [Pontivivens ytuae]|uniref:Zinc metalloprotease n=1 Tax=Pontivivens ytuae TaxID=2789856 RepID=A0A7S9QCN3_9RHOB|nr:RIP metalloprotease RseP [Pontivivens ytuae]QPH53990.1 RIP metalloprotease RseP [Pontivivens ytuae]
MEFISDLPIIGGFLGAVLPFIVVIAIVVFVHEFGHYIVGRWCGIHAEVFSLGFGKELWSRTDSRGTVWRIGALPLGGYVKFLGDADGASRPDQSAVEGMDAETRARSFPGAALWKRALTVSAGPIANFILTIAIFLGFIAWNGLAVEEPVIGGIPDSVVSATPLQAGDIVRQVGDTEVTTYVEMVEAFSDLPSDTTTPFLVERDGEVLTLAVPYPRPPYVVGVRPLSAASQAGIEAGDLLLSANDKPLPDFDALLAAVGNSEGVPIDITLRRGDETMTMTMTPRVEDVPTADGFERRAIIGVTVGTYIEPAVRTAGPIEALSVATSRMFAIITGTIDGIGHMIAGSLSPSNINGPVGIAQVSGETAGQGLTNFIQLIALISTAIGLMNLFPIPVLDGGHLVFYAIEAVTGRQPKGRWVDIAMAVGLAMVLSLMVFATYNDLSRLSL